MVEKEESYQNAHARVTELEQMIEELQKQVRELEGKVSSSTMELLAAREAAEECRQTSKVSFYKLWEGNVGKAQLFSLPWVF